MTTNPTPVAPEELPELPKSRACLWVTDNPRHCDLLRPAPNVVNAFPWPADSKTPEDRAYWREKGFWQEPLYTADQMRAYARAALDQQPAASVGTETLTDEQVILITARAFEKCHDWMARGLYIAREVERHHVTPGATTPAAPDGRSAVPASPDVAKMVDEAKRLAHQVSVAGFNAGVEDAGDAWTRQEKTAIAMNHRLTELKAAIDALGAAATQARAAASEPLSVSEREVKP